MEGGFFATEYTIHFSGPLSSQNVGPIRGIEGTKPLCNDRAPATWGSRRRDADRRRQQCPGPRRSASDRPHPGCHLPLPGRLPPTPSAPSGAATTPLSRRWRRVKRPVPTKHERVENNSTRLPECRAYELVTSAPKAGFATSLFEFGENEAVVYSSNSGNIEDSGQGFLFGNYYVAEAHRQRLGNACRTSMAREARSSLHRGRSPVAESRCNTARIFERSVWYPVRRQENRELRTCANRMGNSHRSTNPAGQQAGARDALPGCLAGPLAHVLVWERNDGVRPTCGGRASG